ncbi:MAG: diacylglycerol kinase family lipid kinase [Clostridia bacterium]|nr:diacylglycerol kinase family lipid kinase [Clostridia bacterium]
MITLLVNPAAGNGRSKKVVISVSNWLKEHNLPFCVRVTSAPGDAKEIAREISSAYNAEEQDLLISIGGDGTFLEIVQGTVGGEMPVASIPAGTGNDFLKSLKVPAEPIAALEHIMNAPVRRIDVGKFNGDLFVNECGAGFDVMVLDYAEKAKKRVRGLLPYLWGVLCTIFKYHSAPMVIEADGEEIFNEDCLVVSVANGKFIGGGIPISPEADPADGKLQLLAMRACSRPRMCSYIPGLLRGKILKFKHTVVHQQVNTVTLRPADPTKSLRVNVDGEISNVDRCEFSVLPAALPIKM